MGRLSACAQHYRLPTPYLIFYPRTELWFNVERGWKANIYLLTPLQPQLTTWQSIYGHIVGWLGDIPLDNEIQIKIVTASGKALFTYLALTFSPSTLLLLSDENMDKYKWWHNHLETMKSWNKHEDKNDMVKMIKQKEPIGLCWHSGEAAPDWLSFDFTLRGRKKPPHKV